MWERDIIRIPGYLIATIIVIVVLLFVTIILIGNKKAENYIRATYSTEILNVVITGNERYGYLRGAVFYKTDHYVATSAKFVGKSFRSDIWKSHGPLGYANEIFNAGKLHIKSQFLAPNYNPLWSEWNKGFKWYYLAPRRYNSPVTLRWY